MSLDLLERRIKASAIQSFVVAGCALLMGLGMLAGAVAMAVTQGVGSAGFMALMGFGGVAVAWMLSENGRAMWPPRDATIYMVLERDPSRVAWAHLTVGKTNGIQIHTVDGHEHTLYANGADSKALLAFVRERAPQAIFGYGVEQKKRYRELVRSQRAAG